MTFAGGRPAAMTVAEKPSSLFYDPVDSLLYVGEYAEPIEDQGVAEPAERSESAKTDEPMPKDDSSAERLVNPEHVSSVTGESGRAGAYFVDAHGNIPFSLTSEDAEPVSVIMIGERVRGIAILRRLGRRYIALSKCSYAVGYRCRMEFHELDPAYSTTISGIKGSYYLDSGLPPEGAHAEEGSEERRTPPTASSGVPGEAEPEDVGTTGTVAIKMSTPPGLESLALFQDTSESFMLAIFSSGAQQYQRALGASGGDVEDSMYRFTVPSLATVKPGIQENVLFVRLVGFYVVAPRCVLPLGDGCSDGAIAGSSVEDRNPRPLSRVELPTTGQRRLVQIVAPGEAATYHLDGYTASPDAAASLPAPTYGEWTPPNHQRALMHPAHRELLDTDELETGNCLVGTKELFHFPMTFVQFNFRIFAYVTFIVVGFEAGGDTRADLRGAVCFSEKNAKASLVPAAGAYIEVFAGIEIPFLFRVGIAIEATVMETQFVPTAFLGLLKDGALRACMDLRLEMHPLAIRVYAFVRLWLCIKFRRKCFKIGW